MPTTVITGATAGIGKALADTFAKEGHNLAICARTSSDLIELKKDLESNYQISVFTQTVDVRNRLEIKAFFDAIDKEFKSIDILINNAGVFLPGSIFEEEEEHLPLMVETNLYSAFYASRSALPLLKKGEGKKHIFNICSIASITAYPNGGSYAISKWAMLGMNDVMRSELLDTHIRVSAILPGATWSRSWSGAEGEIPKERLMEANDIAESVLAAWKMPGKTTVERIVIRPQKGDL